MKQDRPLHGQITFAKLISKTCRDASLAARDLLLAFGQPLCRRGGVWHRRVVDPVSPRPPFLLRGHGQPGRAERREQARPIARLVSQAFHAVPRLRRRLRRRRDDRQRLGISDPRRRPVAGTRKGAQGRPGITKRAQAFSGRVPNVREKPAIVLNWDPIPEILQLESYWNRNPFEPIKFHYLKMYLPYHIIARNEYWKL